MEESIHKISVKTSLECQELLSDILPGINSDFLYSLSIYWEEIKQSDKTITSDRKEVSFQKIFCHGQKKFPLCSHPSF